MDLTTIVVAHDSGPQLAACLASVRREVEVLGLEAEFIVVDNASRDGAPQSLADVTLLRNERNRGFGAAANQGFVAGSARHVLLLNPDAELADGALAPLLAAVDAGAALAAPALVLPDGSQQESPRRFYDLAAVAARRTPFGRTRTGRDAAARHTDTPARGPVDWVTGAAMLLDRDAVPGAGPFDERYFLYFEDVDLCRRLRAEGREVVFEPDARVLHRFGAGSRRQVPWNPLLWHHLQSGARYAHRWSARRWAARWWRGPAVHGLGLLLTAAFLTLLAGVFGLAQAPLVGAGAALITILRPPRIVGRRPLNSPLFDATALTLLALTVAPLTTALPFALVSAAALRAWARSKDVLRRSSRDRTVLLAGDPEPASAIERALRDDPGERLVVSGFVPLDPTAPDGPTPRLRGWNEVESIARDLRVDAVLLAGSPDSLARMAGGVAALRRAGVECSYVLTGPQELLQGERPDALAGLPMLALGAGAESRIAERLVRSAEWVASALGLLVLLPLTPLLLALAALASRERPLHRVPRVGRHERPFGMWRLRSGPDGESGGGALGRFLRRSHLDELPQLLNVLVGEMRLVGPRPVPPGVAERLEPHERARFAVPPGISGMWQLDRLRRWRLEQMITSDLLYLLRWSPRLDARILLETLLGRRTP